MMRRVLLLSVLATAARPAAAQRNLWVALDPKTVEVKPSPEHDALLAELKRAEPAVVRSRREAFGEEMTVDVVSIGSETRFDYMTSQLNTWAKTSRNFYGFSESQDFDPSCPASLADDAARRAYVDTCRAKDLGGKQFGKGHGISGGWLCAQRRPTRSLGWLQHVYGYGAPREEGAAAGATMGLPDVLIVVDDDTSVDIDKVKQMMIEKGGEGGPYIAAGKVMQLGKYGKFFAAHGGLGTYFNRASLQLLTQPLYCEHGKDQEEGHRTEGEAAFVANACEKLAANRAGELDLYRPGDSVFDAFYKLSSRPVFCMHSDWAMGYMITNYSMTKPDEVTPKADRKACDADSVNCHYQTPSRMEKFAAEHPQKQAVAAASNEDVALPLENGVAAALAPEVSPFEAARPQNVAVPVENGMALEHDMAAALAPSYSAEDLALIENLKRTENNWGRGKFNHRKTNLWGKEEEVAAAAERAGMEAEANAAYSPMTVCDRPTRHAMMRPPAANNGCPGFRQDAPVLLLEGMSARGRTGNNLVELLHAVQIARDRGIQLGTTPQSWAVNLITKYWFERTEDMAFRDQLGILEETFCMKVFATEQDLEGWDVVHMPTGDLFSYHSPTPLVEYIPSQLDVLRRLFSRPNAGRGLDSLGKRAEDMCLGINSIFPTPQDRQTAIYTVIHSRSLENGAGERIMRKVAKKSGCDKLAALEMQPEYVRGILEPLGMLNRPIILITDGANTEVIQRLRDDPVIGPVLHHLDPENSSLGGDITLAVMSNVFIGNPASSFSSFIVKARLALGSGHNELWRQKKYGGWQSVCGDHCIFDYDISGAQA